MGFIQSFESLMSDPIRLERMLRKEAENRGHIYLYRIGDTWISFQRSAYFLHQACPHGTDVALSVKGFPYPIAATLVRDGSLRLPSGQAVYQESSYRSRVYKTSLPSSGYAEWAGKLTAGLPPQP